MCGKPGICRYPRFSPQLRVHIFLSTQKLYLCVRCRRSLVAQGICGQSAFPCMVGPPKRVVSVLPAGTTKDRRSQPGGRAPPLHQPALFKPWCSPNRASHAQRPLCVFRTNLSACAPQRPASLRLRSIDTVLLRKPVASPSDGRLVTSIAPERQSIRSGGVPCFGRHRAKHKHLKPSGTRHPDMHLPRRSGAKCNCECSHRSHKESQGWALMSPKNVVRHRHGRHRSAANDHGCKQHTLPPVVRVGGTDCPW